MQYRTAFSWSFSSLQAIVNPSIATKIASGFFCVWMVSLVAPAFGDEPAKPAPIQLGGVFEMIPPAAWKVVPPKSRMVEHEYVAPVDAKEEDAARITVMAAGGSVEANIERWIGQFEGLKKDDAKMEVKEVAGAKVHIVDLQGTFKDSMGGGPFAPGPVKRMEGYRMLGAIVETTGAGKIFIKMTGPQKTVEDLRESFVESLSKLAPAVQ